MMLSRLLTGFIYPRGPMPPAIKAIGNLIPLSYYIRIARGIITKGIGIQLLWSDVVTLDIYSVIAVVLAEIPSGTGWTRALAPAERTSHWAPANNSRHLLPAAP
jgi:hypothetical protein